MEYFKRVCANTRCLLHATGSKRWKVWHYCSNTDFKSFNLKPTICGEHRESSLLLRTDDENAKRASFCTEKVNHPTEETFCTKIYKEKMTATSENLQVMNLLEAGFFSSWNVFQIRGNTHFWFFKCAQNVSCTLSTFKSHYNTSIYRVTPTRTERLKHTLTGLVWLTLRESRTKTPR